MFHNRHKKSRSTTDLPSSSLPSSSATPLASDPISIPGHAGSSSNMFMASSGMGASPATSCSNHTSRAFPVPSMCVFSRVALADEYAPQEAIVPFYRPSSIPLERICMLVSVLESLFRTMDEVTLVEEEEEEEEDEDILEKNKKQKEQHLDEKDDYACRIIGLGTFKVAVWRDWEKDRALVNRT
ncbi:hypothetical protein BX666DRAFT_432635 [Dichotomocladium elegans]|nr:hypothetical protein BX666DRAFT_432635 [Dichotomocladium elegans]